MKYFRRRQEADVAFLGAGAILLFLWLVGFSTRHIYLPGKFGDSVEADLVKDPSQYWFLMNYALCCALAATVYAFIEFLPLTRIIDRIKAKAARDAENPPQRSFLWKLSVFFVIPFFGMIALFVLAIYLGGP